MAMNASSRLVSRVETPRTATPFASSVRSTSGSSPPSASRSLSVCVPRSGCGAPHVTGMPSTSARPSGTPRTSSSTCWPPSTERRSAAGVSQASTLPRSMMAIRSHI